MDNNDSNENKSDNEVSQNIVTTRHVERRSTRSKLKRRDAQISHSYTKPIHSVSCTKPIQIDAIKNEGSDHSKSSELSDDNKICSGCKFDQVSSDSENVTNSSSIKDDEGAVRCRSAERTDRKGIGNAPVTHRRSFTEAIAEGEIETFPENVEIRNQNRSNDSMQNLITSFHAEENKTLDNLMMILNHESRHLNLLTAINQYKVILQQSKISDEVLWNIFRNIDELTEVQKSLVNSLERMIFDWNQHRHSFTNLMELYVYLHIKCKEYAKNTTNAVKELKSLFEKHPKLREALEEVTFDGKVNKLESLLTIPTTWLCNSLEFVKNLRNTMEEDDDKEVLQSAVDKMKDKVSQHRTLQNSYIRSDLFVELLPNDQRKLRHIYLFSGLLVCVKQNLNYVLNTSNSKSLWDVKFSDRFEVKWFIPLSKLVMHPYKMIETNEKRQSEISTLKDKIRTWKMLIISETGKLNEDESNAAKGLKRSMSNNFLKKMMIRREIERIVQQIFKTQKDLLLLSPNCKFTVSEGVIKQHNLLVPSIRDVETWKLDTMKAQQFKSEADHNSITIADVTSLIDRYRMYKNICVTATGPMTHEEGLSGILTINIKDVSGIDKDYYYHMTIEVDSYKLTELKARTKCKKTNSETLVWDESFDIDLDCSLILDILLYQNQVYPEDKENLVGNFQIELKKSNFKGSLQEFETPMLGNTNVKYTLQANLNLVSRKDAMKRQPSIKKTGLFGIPIKNIVAREKMQDVGSIICVEENVPMMLVNCLKLIEKNGLEEEGIYRLSGSKTEINEFYKRLNKNTVNALKELNNYDVHTLTGIVKMYLRELPEPLVMTINYNKLTECSKMTNEEERYKTYSNIIQNLPEPNKTTFIFLLDHFKRVSQHSNKNQMVVGNLGLILGPTLMMPPSPSGTGGNNPSLTALTDIAMETFNSMTLAQIFTQILNGYIKDIIKVHGDRHSESPIEGKPNSIIEIQNQSVLSEHGTITTDKTASTVQ